MLKILAVIPARGGSKSIPDKNIALLGSRPLIQYSIEAALGSKYITKCIVSTESEKIAEISKKLGAEIPFLRPVILATDTALSVFVVEHALLETEKLDNCQYDIIVMLQPTSPFRTSNDIDAALDLLFSNQAESVVSVVSVDAHHPLRMKRIIDGSRLINYLDQGHEDMRPRQLLPPVYIRNGALYINRRHVVLEKKTLVGEDCRAYVMPKERSVNIDDPFDLFLADYLLKKRAIL